MKNIIEILKESNIELTKEQEESVTKLVNENYKTIAEFDKQKEKLSLAENNAKDIQTKFDDFKKSYDGVDVEELRNKINTFCVLGSRGLGDVYKRQILILKRLHTKLRLAK